RPQYDDVGYVFALPDEDDVKILRFKEKYDQIPEDTKDPQLIKAKKRMKKKMPTRNSNRQYWSEEQFEKLRTAPPADLASRGILPWRMLAWLIRSSDDVQRLRDFVRRRMLSEPQRTRAEKELVQMLKTLWAGQFIDLIPEPPVPLTKKPVDQSEEQEEPEESSAPSLGTFGALLQQAISDKSVEKSKTPQKQTASSTQNEEREYIPQKAIPKPRLEQFLQFRGINPVYACYLLDLLGKADEFEQVQLLESVLEVPGSVLRDVRVPRDFLVSGELARTEVDQRLIESGIVPAHRIWNEPPADMEDIFYEDYPPTIAEKVRSIFQLDYPHVHSFRITPVWIVGDLLKFGGDFQNYVSGRDLTKQEGIIFRHLLRFVLLIQEFLPFCPEGMDATEWQTRLTFWHETISRSCREVDPVTTEKLLETGEG
ncbi:MAG: DUF3516 domain-containing protein, partial [Planctomycetaceae bacterium]|nr:DUF3516 domain-containing protein [Planctomycetaceae bacterium]